MAKTPEAARELLMAVWGPARAAAEADARRLEELMQGEGVNDALEPWDWRYYAAIRQRREHDLDEAVLKPYLELENIRDAAFDVAGRLFGLSFVPLAAELYHPDARAWEVRRGERHMGVFIGDYFARSSKRSGRLVLVVPRTEPARRRGPPGRGQRLQLRQGAGRRARAS